MLPGVLYFFINNYLPLPGLIIAFKDINFKDGLFGGDFVGFKNFEFLFATNDAWIITRNTIAYNSVFIVTSIFFAIVVAIFLSELKGKFFVKFYQTAILLPYLISIVIVAFLVNSFLNYEVGFLNNQIFPLLGIKSISWYSEIQYWPIILVIVNSWKFVGYNSIIFLSAINGIDRQYYEAAQLEGASKLQQIWHITLPCIKSIIITMVLLLVGRIFYADFGMFYHVPMNSGTLLPVTNVLDTYVYRTLLRIGDIGMASAAGLYQSVVGFVVVLIANLITKKVSPENALF